MAIVKVFDIKWDGAEGLGLKDEIVLSINNSLDEDKEELSEYISDEISNLSGFCHKGFEYKILKCMLCGGELKEETESNISDYTCEKCDCLQNENHSIYSDVPFYLANYGTDKNIEIFQDFDEAKKESINDKVFKATLNCSNVWFEDKQGWNYEDNDELFINTPYQVLK